MSSSKHDNIGENTYSIQVKGPSSSLNFYFYIYVEKSRRWDKIAPQY
jgi:hypothetical protein